MEVYRCPYVHIELASVSRERHSERSINVHICCSPLLSIIFIFVIPIPYPWPQCGLPFRVGRRTQALLLELSASYKNKGKMDDFNTCGGYSREGATQLNISGG